MIPIDPTALKAVADANAKAAVVPAAYKTLKARAEADADAWKRVSSAITVDPPAPPAPVKPQAAPTGLTAVATGSTVTVSFTTPPGPITGANVAVDGTDDAHKRDTSGINPDLAAVMGPVKVTRILTGVLAGTHTIFVDAYNDQGEGPWAGPFQLTVGPPASVPASPSSADVADGIFVYDQKVPTTKVYETAFGVAHFDVALVHTDLTNWTTLQSGWFISSWRGAGYRLCITFCPFPQGGTLAAAARGDYNPQWRKMLADIAAAFPDAYLRFAHEAECCYPWSGKNDPAAFKAMWAQWAPLARTASPRFRLIHNPIGGTQPILAEALIPDDGLFDVIALDPYGNAQIDVLTGDHRLNWLGDTGRRLGVPTALCEYAPSTYPQNPERSDNDDPGYIHKTAGWIKNPANRCELHIIYNDNNAEYHTDMTDGTKPQSVAAYRQEWATKTGLVAMVRRSLVTIPAVDHNSDGARAAYALRMARECAA